MNEAEGLPGSHSLAFVEDLYEAYLKDPASVSARWRDYFRAMGDGKDGFRTGPSFKPRSIFSAGPAEAVPRRDDGVGFQFSVDKLVRNFRVRGHIAADVNPLGIPRPLPPEMDPRYYGLTEAEMDRPVSLDTLKGTGAMTLRDLLQRLRNTYCRSIGAQFMHIDNLGVREWLQQRMETTQNRIDLSRDEQIRILTRLTDAVIFEEFIQRKYIGAKSFSLEGSESLIPLLDLAIEKAGEQGIREIVMGMAHRGRLNVLANIMGKSPQEIFREFEDVDAQLYTGRGDVKYHLGYGNTWRTQRGEEVHLALCFNPSHLEYVNPVALGRMRSKQDRYGDTNHELGLVLLIHGDAAFAGEGIIQETLNLSELRGYTVGGALHVIVNNQIGFTTPPSEGRSSDYASDVAKMLQSPIFHVNGEDPEAVAQAVRLAMDFRREFKRDVVIDMYGYRRLGHNEGDEPAFTQPMLYDLIAKRKPVREGYLEHLLQLGKVTQEDADHIAAARREQLERELSVARSDEYRAPSEKFTGIWRAYVGGRDHDVEEGDTGAPAELLSSWLAGLTRLPSDFHPNPKIERGLKLRREMAEGRRQLDWAAGEALAFASLVADGVRVRVSGQDSARGTFSHRHAVLFDVTDGHTYSPLQHVAEKQGPFEVFNSPLSEVGVLGFEYGYSLETPDGLVLWEAQFGDFANAAQVIIDQFIASAEAKWHRLSGLVMLLPHGMEGQGPEHSSARLERFLSLAADDNYQVVYPTTPAQMFHVLRRQVLRRLRKPLVVMTPKSLLRNPNAVSSLEDLTSGRFQRVIPADRKDGVKRVLLCTGKVYYDLEELRKSLGREDVAVVRVEQLYPCPELDLIETLAPYPADVPVFWVQEEPENMGAWPFFFVRTGGVLGGRPVKPIARPVAASPATGSHNSHKLEQNMVLVEALG